MIELFFVNTIKVSTLQADFKSITIIYYDLTS